MALQIHSSQLQVPADGPKLEAATKVAIAQLESWCRQEGQDFNKPSSEDARLWRQLLIESLQNQQNGRAPAIRRGDLTSPIGVELNGRRWGQHLKWFNRNLRADLTKMSEKAKLPMLFGGRSSDRKGGRPETSEAYYFLTWSDHSKPAVAADKAPATTPRKPADSKPAPETTNSSTVQPNGCAPRGRGRYMAHI